MSNTYAGHSENAVGHRRAKAFMRANGGAVSKPVTKKAGGPIAKAAGGAVDGAKVATAKKAGGRLDKKARGGPIAKQLGGSIGRKLTPSKHKPHVKINIINNNSRPKPKLVPVPVGMDAGMAAGMPSPPSAPGGLPAPGMMNKGGRAVRKQIGGAVGWQARPNVGSWQPGAGRPPWAGGGGQRPAAPTNPQATAALAARPPLPAQARGTRPFQMGGGVGGPLGGPSFGGQGMGAPNLPPQALQALQGLPDQARGPFGRGFQRGGGIRQRQDGGRTRSESTEMAKSLNRLNKPYDAQGPGRGWDDQEARIKDFSKTRKETGYQRGGGIQPARMNTSMDVGVGSGEGRLAQAKRGGVR